MSAFLPKRGPLPAMAIAAAFAATTPPAEAAAAPLTDSTKTLRADVAALLAKARAAGAEHAASVLDWIATAHIDVKPGTPVNARVDHLLAAHLDHAKAGLVRLEAWAAEAARDVVRLAGTAWTDTAATMRLIRAADAAEPDGAYARAIDAARSVADALETVAEGIETKLRPATRTLTAFTLKAETQFAAATPKAKTPLQAKAVMQPFFDIYASVLSIEAMTGFKLDWETLTAALAQAEAYVVQAAADAHQAPVSLHAELMDRFAAAAEGLQGLKSLIEGNRQLIAVAKAELLQILNETTQLALKEPARPETRRVLRTGRQPDRVEGSGIEKGRIVEPAVGRPDDIRPFGRRIDFDGKAHRLLVGDTY